MKTIVAVNTSPRRGWNTDTIVSEAARGAESAGAQVEKFDLISLEKYTGCISCFGCKREKTLGKCVCRDGLAPVLSAIYAADGLIIGSPNYLGDVNAGCRALIERLIFPFITYKTEIRSYNDRRIPVFLALTSNSPGEFNLELMNRYKGMFEAFVGPTEILTVGETLQVKDYAPFHWTMFNPEERQARRESVFPSECQKAFEAGARLVQA